MRKMDKDKDGMVSIEDFQANVSITDICFLSEGGAPPDGGLWKERREVSSVNLFSTFQRSSLATSESQAFSNKL